MFQGREWLALDRERALRTSRPSISLPDSPTFRPTPCAKTCSRLWKVGKCISRRRAFADDSTTALVGRSVKEQRSEEHTSELQSLMRISYAVFCLKKKTIKRDNSKYNTQ